MVAQVSEITLLPPNATPQERALDLATSRVGDVPVPIRELWSPENCPAENLAFLAWAFGVDEWDENWPEEFKRATISDAVLVQSRKGTVASVRRVLANAGYGTVEFLEGLYAYLHDGAQDYNGFISYGEPSQWATYRAVLDRPITNAQAAQVRRILRTTAPARCKLLQFVFTEANNIYNGAISYDGAFNHGTA